MMYEIRFTTEANEGLLKLAKSELGAYKKALKFIDELQKHPTTGTGHPERLKGFVQERWSRRISSKHRMVYEIYEKEIVVLILTAYGHYNDK